MKYKSNFSFKKLDDNAAHVVASSSLGGIFGEELVEEFFGRFFQRKLALLNEVPDFSGGESFPDAIASNQQKIVVFFVIPR